MQPDADRLDLVFTALADRTRRAMLVRLARGGASVGDLGAPFRLSRPAIAKHLGVLERAGLVHRGTDPRDRRVRRVDGVPAALRSADAWIRHHRRFWSGRLDALERYLERS